MKKLIVLVSFMFSLQASAFWCSAFDKGLDVGTISIATVLECERKDLIKQDLVALFHYEDFCGVEQKGPFYSLISEADTKALPHIVPERWECKLDLASRITRVTVQYICETQM